MRAGEELGDGLGVEAVDLDDLALGGVTGDHTDAHPRQIERVGNELDESGVRAASLRRRRDPGAPAVSVPADELAPRRARRDGDRDPRQSSLTITCLTCV